MTCEIAPAYALAHCAPTYFDTLPSDVDRLVAAFDLDAWLRPEQRIPEEGCCSFGVCGGRGFGKSVMLAHGLNSRVERGSCRKPALMGPNEDRVFEVQVKFLVDLSPPWFRAEPYRGGVRWPNGVVAEAFTPEAPDAPRSGNFDLSWLCEIVAWPRSTRREAYDNITTATRVGQHPLVLWDTTSKGKNEVIQQLLDDNKRDPQMHRILYGLTFDNPLLSKPYLRALVSKYVVGSRKYQEEIEGKIFTESTGALWRQSWLDDHRVRDVPADLANTILAYDPSLSAGPEADEAGLIVVSSTRNGELYVRDDLSGRQTPEACANAIVDRCERDAAGFVYERNHCGDMPRDLVKVIAARKRITVQELTREEAQRPFPRRRQGVIYVKTVTSARAKEDRAEAPAALYQEGRVHHVGRFDLLELEQTTWEPGAKSPNRLDALVIGVAELAGIKIADRARPKGGNAIAGAAAAMAALRVQPGRVGL